MANETIRAIIVEPGKEPYVKEIDQGLKSLQEAVGGYIEVVYPFEDEVGLICNEEGKLEGLPFNRALKSEDGEIYDVIAGTFLIVGLGEEDFKSLSDEFVDKYMAMYKQPEFWVVDYPPLKP